jgi:hypothetical protein
MPWVRHVLIWGAIVIVLVFGSYLVPQEDREIHYFFAACMLLWFFGTFLWIARGIWRFVVR